MNKTAVIGIGIDVASFSEGRTSKGVINVGFPHIVSVGGRHKPSGVGAGIGALGPVISWSPSTAAAYERQESGKKKHSGVQFIRKVAADRAERNRAGFEALTSPGEDVLRDVDAVKYASAVDRDLLSVAASLQGDTLEMYEKLGGKYVTQMVDTSDVISDSAR